MDQATIAVIEKPQFSLEAAAETVHLVRGGTAEFQVSISRADGFSEPLHFFYENLPPGVTAQRGHRRWRPRKCYNPTDGCETTPGQADFPVSQSWAARMMGRCKQAPHITIVLD